VDEAIDKERWLTAVGCRREVSVSHRVLRKAMEGQKQGCHIEYILLVMKTLNGTKECGSWTYGTTA
jgi:hypothetical protein